MYLVFPMADCSAAHWVAQTGVQSAVSTEQMLAAYLAAQKAVQWANLRAG